MNLKGFRFPENLVLLSVRWYLSYGLSCRDLEEMLKERGLGPDHTTVYRWVRRFNPALQKAFRRRKLPVGDRWRMDETYLEVAGQWRYLYRAVDEGGETVDFLLIAHRDRAAARRFLEKATGQNGLPTLVHIYEIGANKAGIEEFNGGLPDGSTPVEVRQCKYLNNVIEQDHRRVKRRVGPMLGFKSFLGARGVVGGIEMGSMIRKRELASGGLGPVLSPAEQFYRLAA